MEKEFFVSREDPRRSSESFLRGVIKNFFGDPTVYVTYWFREGECYDLDYNVFLEEKDALEYMEKGNYRYSSSTEDGKRQFYRDGILFKGMLTCKVTEFLDELIEHYEFTENYLREDRAFYQKQNEKYRKDTQGVIEENVAREVRYIFNKIVKEDLEKILNDTNNYLEKLK